MKKPPSIRAEGRRPGICRAPFAGINRIRFQGTLSIPQCGIPLAVREKLVAVADG
jgi:hypothetical protein